MADANARNTEIVKLNVGGSRFETTRATLTQFPDSMLGTMFSGRHALKVKTRHRLCKRATRSAI
jgi:hypothetical protein